MPKVSFIEKSIWDNEGFEVKIKQNGLDVRSDKVIPASYNFERMTKNSYTVAQWKEKFQTKFPGYDVDVLMANGTVARGNTKLSTVRDSYLSNN